jgi:hypothetical protein
MRVEATHVLLTPGPLNFAVTVLFNSASRYLRARFRIHWGSFCECQYGLMTFGLPSALLPYNSDGTLKLGNHKKWYQRRVIKETEEKLLQHQQQQRGETITFSFSGIELPSPTDILLGKGKPILDHRGNQVFQEVMQRYKVEYLAAQWNGGKTRVARQIINEVKHDSDKSLLSGRFLRRRPADTTSGWWEELTEEDALIAQVCSSFRNMKMRHKTKQGLSMSTTTLTASTAPSRSNVTYNDYRNDYQSETLTCCWQGRVSSSYSDMNAKSSQWSTTSIPTRLEEDNVIDEELTNHINKRLCVHADLHLCRDRACAYRVFSWSLFSGTEAKANSWREVHPKQ